MKPIPYIYRVKTEKQLKVVILSIFFLQILLSSCTPGKDSEAGGSFGNMSPENPQVLVVWNHEYPTYNQAMREKWIPEFEASHPGVTIQYEVFPYSGDIVTFDTKLLTSVSGGTGPDVWSMASHNFSQAGYIDLGLIFPLDPAVFGYESTEEMVKDYPPRTLDVFLRDNKLYALIGELTSLSLFYNKTMFRETGIPYLPEDRPVSWQTIADISQQLLELNPETGTPEKMGYQFGFFANYPALEWYIQDFYPVMRQFGQHELFLDGAPAGNTPAMISALRLFYDFTHTYKAYDPYFVTNWFEDFASGRVAMVTAGSWYPSVIKNINPEIDFGCVPHPVTNLDNTDTYHSIMYSFGWAVNAGAEPELQKTGQEFIAFILGKKGEIEQANWWLENVGMFQPRIDFLESSDFLRVVAEDPWMKQFVDIFDSFSVDYYQHSSSEEGRALVRAINRVVYNRMQPRESADLLQNELLLMQ